MDKPCLLLLGHGSHLDRNSSAPVHAIADSMRGAGQFKRVDTAFWKEEPALARWSDLYQAEDTVVAVPVFISEGYFTREVLPRELGMTEAGGDSLVRGIRLLYTPPAGSHAAVANVIVQRASEAGAGPGDAVAVLGHGTRRNSDSERNVFAQADAVRESGAFGEVVAVFMDQAPEMGRVFELTAAERVFMVPLFIAEGWHVGQTIPAELDITRGEIRRGERRLVYTDPVGTHPDMAKVVLELASGALA